MLSTKDVFKCKYANGLKVEEQKKTYHGNSQHEKVEGAILLWKNPS